MRQIIQELSTGTIRVAEVPVPTVLSAHVLIETTCSLISPGTERMLLQFGRSGWLDRARQQPDKVRQVWEKVRADGVFSTVEAVRAKLDQPIALGYANVGRVVELGKGTSPLRVGDRVLSNGPHADFVRASRNLVVRVPPNVGDEHAAFGILGAIALQGIRLAAPTIGETFVVTGLGLIGLLAVQLLRANGCRVIGVDFDAKRLELAERFGAIPVDAGAGESAEQVAHRVTDGRGVDGVLLCAATDSSEPISQGARMCRKRGRIILIGVTGLELSRADFYEKEISFQVSCSYGPGRYDPEYEQRGHDYPYGFVRWTEQRNIQAFLDLAADGRLNLDPLLTCRFDISQAAEAYEMLASNRSVLGILLTYDESRDRQLDESARVVELTSPREHGGSGVSFIGSGNYASRVLMPAFSAAGARFRTLCNTGGVSGIHVAGRHNFERLTTDIEATLSDPETKTVVIVTRHDSHAELVEAALRRGKHVFVEKPLAISLAQLGKLEAVRCESAGRAPILTVGFNRRFSTLALRMKQLLDTVSGPKSIVYTVNAGSVSSGHWVQDPGVGGGRIVGEACHFIDLIRWLAGAPVFRWSISSAEEGGRPVEDCATITLCFADGSMGTVHYFSSGNRSFPKERIEVFTGGRILQLDDFRRLRGYGWRGFSSTRLWRQDKGQLGLVRAFLSAVNGSAAQPISDVEIFEIARISIECAEALRSPLGLRESRRKE